MKRYIIILMIILALTPVLLVGCVQEAELKNRITILETKLTAAESTINVLQERIEQLEDRSLTEADILNAIRGKEFWASVGPLAKGTYYDNHRVQIKVE